MSYSKFSLVGPTRAVFLVSILLSLWPNLWPNAPREARAVSESPPREC